VLSRECALRVCGNALVEIGEDETTHAELLDRLAAEGCLDLNISGVPFRLVIDDALTGTAAGQAEEAAKDQFVASVCKKQGSLH